MSPQGCHSTPRRSNPFIFSPKQKTALRTVSCFGGGYGIRTHVRLLSNGFQDRLVMTASITLHMKFSLELSLELPLARFSHCRKSQAPRDFFGRPGPSEKKFSRPCPSENIVALPARRLASSLLVFVMRGFSRYDRFDNPPYAPDLSDLFTENLDPAAKTQCDRYATASRPLCGSFLIPFKHHTTFSENCQH